MTEHSVCSCKHGHSYNVVVKSHIVPSLLLFLTLRSISLDHMLVPYCFQLVFQYSSQVLLPIQDTMGRTNLLPFFFFFLFFFFFFSAFVNWKPNHVDHVSAFQLHTNLQLASATQQNIPSSYLHDSAQGSVPELSTSSDWRIESLDRSAATIA